MPIYLLLGAKTLIINGLYKFFRNKLHKMESFYMPKLHKMESFYIPKLHKMESFYNGQGTHVNVKRRPRCDNGAALFLGR